MNGARRVIVFCTMTAVLPIILLIMPLYLRHSLYADVVYAVTESDILEISDGVSTIFCSSHTLEMNTTFNAFQMSHRPEITSYRKHIRLKKSMTLPDDTLEYWGFYLLRGATVSVSVCSRFKGASIIVVKDDRTLRTCGMLNHNTNKARTAGIFLPEAHSQVKITYETNAQLINSKEHMSNYNNNTRVNEKDNSTKLSVNNVTQDAEINKLIQSAKDYINNHSDKNRTDSLKNQRNSTRKVRHAKRRFNKKSKEESGVKKDEYVLNEDDNNPDAEDEKKKKQRKIRMLINELNNPGIDIGAEVDEKGQHLHQSHGFKRNKRNQEPIKAQVLDQGIQHGGNANAHQFSSEQESSQSSFEDGLLNCYDGNFLLMKKFNSSDQCKDVHYLENGEHMTTHHNVTEDGYYYYIFYSDNDYVSNDIHAIFDIYKPTFQYENVTKSCVNSTKCTFPLKIMSNDRVIIEVPTRDGIEHEQDDISLLVSVCHPRMGMYIIFPIALLLFILSCAFI